MSGERPLIRPFGEGADPKEVVGLCLLSHESAWLLMRLEGLSVFCRVACPNEFSGDCVMCVPAVWKNHPAPIFYENLLSPSQAGLKAFLSPVSL